MELLEHIYGNHRSDYWPIRNTEILPNNVPNRLVYEIYHVLHVASVDNNRMNFGNKFPYTDYTFGNSSEQLSDLNKQQRESASNAGTNTDVRSVQNPTPSKGALEPGEPDDRNCRLQRKRGSSNLEANTCCLNPDLLNAISSAGTPPEAQQEDLLHTPDKPVVWKDSPHNAPLRESKIRRAKCSSTPRQLFPLDNP
ncbi:hypothetical protein [Echinococcus multilocularis]|uniref:Uncharacterized protein n=1 Tax=Echinococcus multilocularis TaxID=6211 RepID=A0A068Y191_ECHMU|nr:hypothetical protein [Echinococcus multilocularis]